MLFKKAEKSQSKLRLSLTGPSGAGKTYTALSVASYLGKKIAVIDTERGSASKYADLFDFDVIELTSFHPDLYIKAIEAAGAAGYDCLIIDSLSHAWFGKDGALEQVDKAQARQMTKNSYTAWRDVTPLQNRLVDTILQAPCHVFVTMRAKTEYVMEKDERTGKMSPRKIGLAPVQRDGFEYEVDLAADVDLDHNFIVSKSRIATLADAVMKKPGKDLAEMLKEWLNTGKPQEAVQIPTPTPTWLEEKIKELGHSVKAVNDRYLEKHGKRLGECSEDEIDALLDLLKSKRKTPAHEEPQGGN